MLKLSMHAFNCGAYSYKYKQFIATNTSDMQCKSAVEQEVR